jgi:hypothetical protein
MIKKLKNQEKMGQNDPFLAFNIINHKFMTILVKYQ